MIKTLITGASGFIGKHTLPLLLQAGHEVHAISSNKKNPAISGINWHQADLKSYSQTKRLIADIRPTHLLHFAWCTKPGIFWDDPENKQWVQASLDLLKAFQIHGGERIVFAGTCAEYDWNEEICSEEKTPSRPNTLYGNCKYELLLKADTFCKKYRLSFCWGRIFFVYGPHEHPARLIPSVINSLLNKKTTECTHGEQYRDLLYVEDVASGFVALLCNEVTGIINIGSGESRILRNIIETIGEKVGYPELIKLGSIPSRPGEPEKLVANVSKLHEEVGWSPKFNLDRGLDQTIEWWKEINLNKKNFSIKR
jgi:nucleoside-diphosphate-sugar epimerase